MTLGPVRRALVLCSLAAWSASAGMRFERVNLVKSAPPDSDVASISLAAYFGGPFGSWIPYGGYVDRARGLYDFDNGFVPVACPALRRAAVAGFHVYLVDSDCGAFLVDALAPGVPGTITNGLPAGITTLFNARMPSGAFTTYVGTSGEGVFRFAVSREPSLTGAFTPDRAGLPPGADVLAIGQAGESIYVSLSSGELFEKDADGAWRAASAGLPARARIVAIGGAREAWAAFERGGLWRRTVDGNWVRDETVPDDLSVSALAGAGDTVLAAAGTAGVLRLTSLGWQSETSGLPPGADVRALAVVNAGGALGEVFEELYAGTAADAIFGAAATIRVRTLPAVVDTTGAGGEPWRTSLTVQSRGLRTQVPLIAGGPPLAYAAGAAPGIVTADAGAWLASQSLPIPPGRAAESLSTTFSYPYGNSATDTHLLARVYASDANGGTYGVSLPDVSDLDAAEEEASVYGLRSLSGVERSNLAVAQLPGPFRAGSPTTLSVEIFASDGTRAPQALSKTLQPGEWFQWNDVLRLAGLPDGASGYARVTRTAGSDPWTAYGVRNDSGSSDGAVVPSMRPHGPSSVRRALVPVILDIHGAAGSHFTTELTVANDAPAARSALLAFRAAPGYGAPEPDGDVALSLAAGEQRSIPDVVAFLREAGAHVPANASGDVAGTLLVTFPGMDLRTPGNCAVLARTTTPNPDAARGGRFGVSYTAIAWGQGARERASILPIAWPGASRTNIAVVNTGGGSGGPLTLQFPSPLDLLSPPARVTLLPGEWFQVNGVPPGTVARFSGDDTFLVYGVTNDAMTSDGAIVPMRFVDR